MKEREKVARARFVARSKTMAVLVFPFLFFVFTDPMVLLMAAAFYHLRILWLFHDLKLKIRERRRLAEVRRRVEAPIITPELMEGWT